MRFRYLAILFLALAGPVLAQSAQAQAGLRGASQTEQSDLDMIVDFSLGVGVYRGMIEQGMMLLRSRMETNPEWQELERHYPGISEVRLNAVRNDALSGLPDLVARVRASATARWLSRTQAPQRARFAAYLRTSFPQRFMHAEIHPRPAETVTMAVARLSAELDASKTARERRLEIVFNTSPDGRLFGRLLEQFRMESQEEVNAGVVEMLRAALNTGTDAARHFVDQADASGQRRP